MEYRGKVKNGVVVFEVPLELPDGTDVAVRAERIANVSRNDDLKPPQSSLADRLLSIAGTVDAPADWAANHDHYIHGGKKQR